jgi:membrane protease YdiL (CAAX protease family)
MSSPDTSAPSPDAPLTAGQRGLSFVEFTIGAGIVIAHNVFHVVPNEVPILFVLGLASIRLREGSWRAVGLGRPKSWWLTVLIAMVTALLLIMVQFVTEPLAHAMGLHAAKSAATSLGLKSGDIWSALKVLGIAWTFAAFGEEIGYRRYLLGLAADIGNRSTAAHWIALLSVSILFGLGHYYQGPAGVFTTACDGFVIGAAYLLTKRNLWVAVLAHGFFDTIAFGAVFLGLAD